MNHVFTITESIRVPDDTLVFPFLNPMDATSNLAHDLFDGFSIAAGDIEPRHASKIHVLPVATQVTFVIRGTLRVGMKDGAVGTC